jgi:serine protease AprX
LKTIRFFAGMLCLCLGLWTGAGNAEKKPPAAVSAYADVRGLDLRGLDLDLALIRTLWFNEKTVWDPDDRILAMNVMALGKNPGLGVRSLHARGLTGLGVNVAIIDQNMCLDHPEFAGKIAIYRDMGCFRPADEGSMHGPAVTSLLVGQTIGTAPGARVFYAAVPSWNKDAQYYADALDWICAENRLLAVGQKIRAVSVSAAPSGQGSPFTVNNAAWDQAVARAEAEGILVLDCTVQHGWVQTGYYNVDAPEDVTAASSGFPKTGPPASCAATWVCAPNSFRTQAEEYGCGAPSYQYMGQGGLSWAVPYVAGVLALGWQLQPAIDSEHMVGLLRAAAYVKNGCRIIDPPRFIDLVSDWPVLTPDAFTLQRLENNLIFTREFVNRLAWRKGGDPSTVAKYRLYRREKSAPGDSWQPLIELAGDVLSYDDRGLRRDQSFAYAIRAVGVHGLESDAATVEN